MLMEIEKSFNPRTNKISSFTRWWYFLILLRVHSIVRCSPSALFLTVQTALGFPGSSETAISVTSRPCRKTRRVDRGPRPQAAYNWGVSSLAENQVKLCSSRWQLISLWRWTIRFCNTTLPFYMNANLGLQKCWLNKGLRPFQWFQTIYRWLSSQPLLTLALGY